MLDVALSAADLNREYFSASFTSLCLLPGMTEPAIINEPLIFETRRRYTSREHDENLNGAAAAAAAVVVVCAA